MPYLKHDIYSLVNSSECYGRARMEVDIVSRNGGHLIVKGKSGERYGFPCLAMDVVDDLEELGTDAKSRPVKTGEVKKSRWAKASISESQKPAQNSLF